MRIIAGVFKSRVIKDPTNNRTHPMSEKIRGALFNSIGDIAGLDVLDAFSGTGAVGIEALSRGAKKVYAVEINKDSFDVLKHNRDLVTDEESMSVHRANVRSWLKNNAEIEFDLVLADPPYDAVGMNAIEECALHVRPGGLIVLSLPPAEHVALENFTKIDEKRYGNAKLVFYRRNK
ncbi:RsmD family RNA methyltransferase [Candidatus Saccharibacteria bacterium]|nr:RsmD family RNA methyltransferase [Candidatus Saccharibacteria bacterium]